MVRAAAGHSHRSMDEIRLAALMRKQPQNASGSGAFLRAATRQALDQQATDASSRRRRAVARCVVKTHQRQFRQMPIEMRARFHAEVSSSKRRKCSEIQLAISTLQEKVAIAKAKKQEEESKASVLRVSYTGWDAQDLSRINEMFRSSDCTRAMVQQARARALHGPPMPSLELRSALAEADDGSWEETQPNCLAWVAQMCRQRDEFSKVALIFGDSMDAPPFAFALGHASKQPFWAALFCL